MTSDLVTKWKGATGGRGGSGQEATKVIYAEERGGAEIYRVCVIPDWQVEQIAEAVVRKLKEKEESRYCDRNICVSNEYNGISCDECEVAKYHNIEDDDTPCQNCEEPNAD